MFQAMIAARDTNIRLVFVITPAVSFCNFRTSLFRAIEEGQNDESSFYITCHGRCSRIVLAAIVGDCHDSVVLSK
jgi:hypothetical protein